MYALIFTDRSDGHVIDVSIHDSESDAQAYRIKQLIVFGEMPELACIPGFRDAVMDLKSNPSTHNYWKVEYLTGIEGHITQAHDERGKQ